MELAADDDILILEVRGFGLSPEPLIHSGRRFILLAANGL